MNGAEADTDERRPLGGREGREAEKRRHVRGMEKSERKSDAEGRMEGERERGSEVVTSSASHVSREGGWREGAGGGRDRLNYAAIIRYSRGIIGS